MVVERVIALFNEKSNHTLAPALYIGKEEAGRTSVNKREEQVVVERWGISGEVQTARVAAGGGADEEEHGEEIHGRVMGRDRRRGRQDT